jgi:hypothetical protein
MARTPLPHVDNSPGLYVALSATPNTDAPTAVPDGAKAVILWFETSSANSTVIRGRVAVDDDGDVVTGITGTDAKLGYHPPQAVEYDLNRRRVRSAGVWGNAPVYLHLASSTASAVVRGMWLF